MEVIKKRKKKRGKQTSNMIVTTKPQTLEQCIHTTKLKQTSNSFKLTTLIQG